MTTPTNKTISTKEFLEALQTLSKLNKKSINNLIELIQNEKLNQKRNIRVHEVLDLQVDPKKHLIGILPALLLDKRIFERNDTIVKFAEKNLKLDIPYADKKSREELIGRIIVELDKQDSSTIIIFSQVLDKILNKNKGKASEDFFLEWNKTINQL